MTGVINGVMEALAQAEVAMPADTATFGRGTSRAALERSDLRPLIVSRI